MSTHYRTAAQVADELGCAKSTVIRAARKHDIGFQPGRELLFSAADRKKIRQIVRPGQKGCPMFVAGNDLWKRRRSEKRGKINV